MKNCVFMVFNFVILACVMFTPVLSIAEEAQDGLKVTPSSMKSSSPDKLSKPMAISADNQVREQRNATNDGNQPNDGGWLSEDIVRLSQVIAAFGSLGAMIFLLWQNMTLQRQTRELEHSIRSSTYQNIVTHYMDINKTLMSNEKLGAAFEQFDDSAPESDEQQESRKKWLAFWLINHYENAYMQRQIDALPEELWKGIEADCLLQLGRPYVARLWASSRDLFSEGFRVFIDDKLNKISSKKDVEHSVKDSAQDVGSKSKQSEKVEAHSESGD